MYLVRGSQQEGIKLVKLSPQKNYKTNPDNAAHNILTYKLVLIEM